MKLAGPFHSFDVSFDEAKRIQEQLRTHLVLSDTVSSDAEIELVGGVDVAFITHGYKLTGQAPGMVNDVEALHAPCISSSAPYRAKNRFPGIRALAGIVVIDTKCGRVVETVSAVAEVFFPYVPGFLSFREGPAVLAAVRELSHTPGVMIYDGCGIAHPRGCGLATHMGILTGIPSIGCAKSHLCGTCDKPGFAKGEWTEIVLNGTVVGSCLRTRDGVKPVFVSPGTGFSIEGARRMVLSLAWKYRLPAPTRLAHSLVTREKQSLV